MGGRRKGGIHDRWCMVCLWEDMVLGRGVEILNSVETEVLIGRAPVWKIVAISRGK